MPAVADEPKLVSVKLRQSIASPGTSAEKGDVVNVTPLEAHRLVKRGLAEPLENSPLPKLDAADAKKVNVVHVATVRAKGNRAIVEPLETKLARDAEEKRKKQENRRNGIEEEDEL
jgi:flagellar biosynthesis/type III secretory pathway M-ring protein FliF/YscJ